MNENIKLILELVNIEVEKEKLEGEELIQFLLREEDPNKDNIKLIDTELVKSIDKEILKTEFQIPVDNKKSAIANVIIELEYNMRIMIHDYEEHELFLEWIEENIETSVYADKDTKILNIKATNIEPQNDYEEELKSKIAKILYDFFSVKNIRYLRECVQCNRIYIPKTLRDNAKFCDSNSCKRGYFFEHNPHKTAEYFERKKGCMVGKDYKGVGYLENKET